MNVLFDTHVDDWVEVLLELDSSSFLLQERENKSGETKRMRNNPNRFPSVVHQVLSIYCKIKDLMRNP